MLTTPDPSLLQIATGLTPLIRDNAREGEASRRLPAPVVEAFAETGIFRICRPKELGGLEADPITVLHVFEELSRADGAAGWCAMISGAGSVFDAFIPREGGREMYADPKAVTAGVLAPTGRALAVDGGYRVSGRWAIASGCHHCDWLGATAVVFDGDAPRMGPPGAPPQTVVALLPAAECRIVDTWHVAGLRGTGSHDFEVADTFVPHARCIVLPMGEPQYAAPLFAFPFFGFLAMSIASTALGIARASIDELVRVARAKTPFGTMSKLATRPTTQLAVAEAEAALRSGRAFLLEVVDELWRTVLDGGAISLEQRARLRLAATHATASAARAVDLMYTAGGASALYDDSLLQRCFRDVHAITQHFTVAPPTNLLHGSVLLGLEADTMML